MAKKMTVVVKTWEGANKALAVLREGARQKALRNADAEERTGKVAVPESEDDIEIDDSLDDDEDDSTFIPDEEEGDEDVTDIIGDVSGDEET